MTSLINKLRESDLITYDNCIFVDELFNESELNDFKTSKSSREEIERHINHLHMFMIEEDYEAQRYLAQELKDIWEKKAKSIRHPVRVEILDNGEVVDICMMSTES